MRKKQTPPPANLELVADGFATIKEAMAYLRVSDTTLYGMMTRGEIRYAKVGRHRRIPWKSLHEYGAARIVDVERPTD